MIMKSITYYYHSLTGYWPTAKALSSSFPSALLLFVVLISIPVRKRLLGRRPFRLVVSVGNRRVPLYVRDGTDISALREIFASGEYEFPELPQIMPKRIVDLGAHIGSAALFFHTLYPDAHITAYEPDPENFQMLLRNLNSLENITCINAAVAATSGTITFYPNEGGSTRSSTIRSYDSREGISVMAVDIETVLAESPDLIKFDIEGGEYDLFVHAPQNLLQRVSRYMGEIHHTLIGKTAKEFEELFPNFSFIWKDRGGEHSIVAISQL